jgi:hypothetical protein
MNRYAMGNTWAWRLEAYNLRNRCLGDSARAVRAVGLRLHDSLPCLRAATPKGLNDARTLVVAGRKIRGRSLQNLDIRAG